MRKVKWGILSTAKIAMEKVIPAMQNGQYCEISGIASREKEKAESAAKLLGISKAYSGYQELLDDPEIEAVYIPLPNHLHVEWAIKALESGKHVLCEKPIGLNTQEAKKLLDVSKTYSHLKIMEAFMYRFHPQWIKTKQLVDSGKVGSIQTIQSAFAYHNIAPENIRNIAAYGGGGLMDIGCYCISLSRFIINTEPEVYSAKIKYHEDFGTDVLVSAIMDFGETVSSFTCGTQLAPYQRVNILGDVGRIEIEIPFNAPPDASCKISFSSPGGVEEIRFDPCDQYTVQGDEFAKAIIENTAVPTPLEDAVANMRVIDKIFHIAK